MTDPDSDDGERVDETERRRLWREANGVTYVSHNHVTRDVKPEGECPSCDETRRRMRFVRIADEERERRRALLDRLAKE